MNKKLHAKLGVAVIIAGEVPSQLASVTYAFGFTLLSSTVISYAVISEPYLGGVKKVTTSSKPLRTVVAPVIAPGTWEALMGAC